MMSTERAEPPGLKLLAARDEKRESQEAEGRPVSYSLSLQLKFRNQDEYETIDLPRIRFVHSGSKNSTPEPFGPDRARVWKKTGEWIQEILINPNKKIEEKRYQNRLKAEASYFHNKEKPDLYKWQEDDETLEKLRPDYRHIRKKLVTLIGKPKRSDFDKLYPHQYDDPGLSERARRIVRDLKAVFDQDIVVED